MIMIQTEIASTIPVIQCWESHPHINVSLHAQ